MASLPQAAEPTLLPLAAGRTDVGRRRNHNEDQILLAEELGVFAVADGMGGHQAGDVASSVAATALEEFFAHEREVDDEVPEIEDLGEGAKRLVCAVHHMNDEVFARSGRSANQGGMGSTVVALFVSLDEGLVHVCHVGDSRCYRIRNDTIELLTEDHSMINEALRLNPDLSDDILSQLPSNVVTRALGTKESVRPDVRSEPMVEGDLYLLCSDGLSGEVTDEQMLDTVLEAGEELEAACDRLVSMANEAGGRDNVSAVLVRIGDDAALSPEPTPSGQGLVVVEPDEREHQPDNRLEADEGDITVGEDEAALPWESQPPPSDEVGDSEPPLIDTTEYEEAVGWVHHHHPDPGDGSVRAMPVVGLGRMPAPPAELRARRCPACNHGLLPEEKFCGMCGARTEEEDAEAIARCDACGHEVLLGTAYCVECGVLHGF